MMVPQKVLRTETRYGEGLVFGEVGARPDE
jgi:hypothetical protein